MNHNGFLCGIPPTVETRGVGESSLSTMMYNQIERELERGHIVVTLVVVEDGERCHSIGTNTVHQTSEE